MNGLFSQFAREMNDSGFSSFQKSNCWFTFAPLTPLPAVDPAADVESPRVRADDVLFLRHIFAILFGAFGYTADPKRAAALCAKKLSELPEPRPEDWPDEEAFFERMNVYAQYRMLYGTALAYLREYVRAAGHLISALKTGAIALCMPYSDFIRWVLSRLDEMPAEPAEYHGRGFSADLPMGGRSLNGGSLNASAAEMIIPALKGDRGEIVLAHYGRSALGPSRYGRMRRFSTWSSLFENCIDVYEVLLLDASEQLKKARFFFNGYFAPGERNAVRLPDGFSLCPVGEAAYFFRVVD